MGNQDSLERHDPTISSPTNPVQQKSGQLDGRSRSRYGNWFVNGLILLVSTILLLVLCEGLMRWLDGYELFNSSLDSAPSYQQPSNGTGK